MYFGGSMFVWYMVSPRVRQHSHCHSQRPSVSSCRKIPSPECTGSTWWPKQRQQLAFEGNVVVGCQNKVCPQGPLGSFTSHHVIGWRNLLGRHYFPWDSVSYTSWIYFALDLGEKSQGANATWCHMVHLSISSCLSGLDAIFFDICRLLPRKTRPSMYPWFSISLVTKSICLRI